MVWKRRNDFVFNGECLPLPGIYRIGFVWASHFAATIPDVAMESHASIDSVQWVAPLHDWVSLNTDTVVYSPNNFGAIGDVLRGSAGDWLRDYYKFIGVQYDSSVAIRLLLDPMAANSSSNLVCRISSLRNRPWSMVFQGSQSTVVASLSLGSRETNMVADGLSRLSSVHDFQLQIFDDIPESYP
ncbi:hypothetical protein V6N11_027429 [Hibiscus sabdariffa]|uniref:Uncharacterized protein n=1 Tax=Hibiscus sabdariffa TaxID=183260 RepID=A0ABR2PGX3_9ROSI